MTGADGEPAGAGSAARAKVIACSLPEAQQLLGDSLARSHAFAPAIAGPLRRMWEASWITVRSSCIAVSSVRIVPAITNSSGIIFSRTPALILPTVIITGAFGRLDCLATIICNPVYICVATAIGSIPCHGYAPCVCFPFTFIENQSLAAIVEPGLYLIVPISVFELICMPNIASIFGWSITPSLTISSAPPSSPAGAPSSAG